MKNKKLNLVILFLALALVLYFTLKDDLSGVINELKKVNLLIFLIAILLFLVSLIFKAASLNLFIKEKNPSYNLKKAYELTLIGQFLNGITPFQSGGQPFQIYLLKKDGIRIADSTGAMIKDFISYQVALIIMGIISILLSNKLSIFSNDKYLNFLVFVGFFINLVVLVILLLVAYAKKVGTKIATKIIDFIFKFKITKKFGTTKENVLKSLDRFYATGRELRKNKSSMIKGVLYNIINLTLLYMVPYVIFKSLSSTNVLMFSSVISTAFVMLIGNFIPIPGATGGIEYGFIKFFGVYENGSFLASAMLLWRFVTYILGMLMGFICLLLKKEGMKDENRIIY